MTDQELLRRAEEFQTFQLTGTLEDCNEYNGLDRLTVEDIVDNKLYAVVHQGNIDALESGKNTCIQYFFDQATLDKFYDPATDTFDAKALGQALQVKPYHNIKNMPDGHAEYRYSIVCFDRMGDIRTPVGLVSENNQFGEGGAHQCFIPESEFNRMRQEGVLVYNKSESLINKGTNYSISETEYLQIDEMSRKRVNNCIEKKLPHPEPDVCKTGFEKAEPISGIPFDKEGRGKMFENSMKHDNYMKTFSLSDRIEAAEKMRLTNLNNGIRKMPTPQLSQEVL